jgi:hypothetical protein
MKVTQVQIRSFLKKKLSTDEAWALRALVKIHEFQTLSEQAAGITHEANSVGFSGCDAEFLTSLNRQYLTRGTLSPKQMGFVFKKIHRYWGQVKTLIPAEKLESLVAADLQRECAHSESAAMATA